MKVKGGASATTRLTKRQLLKEGKEYGQILLAAEDIMKNENDRRWGSGASAATGLTRSQQLERGQEYGQILPNSGRKRIVMKTTGGASATTRLTRMQQLEEGKEYGQILPSSGGHYV